MHARWLVAVLVLSGCERCAESKPPVAVPKPVQAAPAPVAAPAPPTHSEKAEVEFFGDWKPGPVKAAKVVFVAQAEPCLPINAAAKRYGDTELTAPGPFSAEYFIPQDSRGHVCLFGYDDAGKVVGAAAWEKNPLRFFGEGEVVFANIALTLAEVK